MLVRSAVRLIAVGSLDADLARVSPVPAQMSQRDALRSDGSGLLWPHCLPEGVGAIVLQS